MQDIDKAIQISVNAWNRRDPAALAAAWDEWEPAPLYLAEESPLAFTSHQAIRDYWQRTLTTAGFISIETHGLVVQPLSAELAAALYRLRWLGSFPHYERPIGGDTRVSAILRRRAEGWRFIHYVEAPLAPLAYLRGLYEQFAARPPAYPAAD